VFIRREGRSGSLVRRRSTMLSVIAIIASAAATFTATAPRVPIIQFVMAKCPMSTSLHAKFARTVMSSGIRSIVNFTQSFVGGPVGEGPVNATNWMSCFHGPSECEGHTIMLCARNVSRRVDPHDYRWFDLVTCMDGPLGIPGVTYGLPTSIPQDAASCAVNASFSEAEWASVTACATGPQGASLLRRSHFSTMTLFAQHGGYTPQGHGYRPPLIPNIWIAGKEFNDPLVHARDPYADLVQRVCAAYTGVTKPTECAGA
jgi:hypothetical protein